MIRLRACWAVHAPSRVGPDAKDVHPPGRYLHDEQHSVESGLSLLSVFAVPRVDDRQMTISPSKAQSSSEEGAGAWKRLVCLLSEVTGSRSIA
jgi:hypothetical protein